MLGTVRAATLMNPTAVQPHRLDASLLPSSESATVDSALSSATDLDKLIPEIETNGAITAEDAVYRPLTSERELAVFAQPEGGELLVFDAPAQRAGGAF